MYGIFTYIYHINQPNVGKYTIHGSSGNENIPKKNTNRWALLHSIGIATAEGLVEFDTCASVESPGWQE